MAHALVDSNTLYYIQIINPSNKVFNVRRRSRLGTIIEAYELGIITVIMPAVLTALTVAAAMELTLTPALTQEYTGILSINLLVLVNQVPATLTDYFITQLSNIPLIKDKFDLTLLIKLILIILNPMGEIKTGATVGEPLDRPLNLQGLNALAKPVKPER